MKQAAMVIDANTGAVLHEQFADAPRHPASLTKMMTLYLAFEAIKQKRASGDTLLSISERAAGVAPSKLELPVGDQIALQDAIKALITKSANDVAVAIAETLGGSEIEFVRLMNAKAREIGMARTRFTNASGLPDPDQITTARDMVTLGMRLADDFPDYFRLFSIRQFEYRGKVYKSHNTLLHGFPGMDGIKTGYTRMSGFNLVSSVHLEGKHVVAAVFGGSTAQTRNAHMRSLLFQSIEKASTVRTRPAPRPGKPPAAPLIASAEPQALPPVVMEEPAPKAQKKAAEREKKQAKEAAALKLKQDAPAAAPRPTPVVAETSKTKPAMKFRTTKTDGTIDQIAAVLREQEVAAAPAPPPSPVQVADAGPTSLPAPSAVASEPSPPEGSLTPPRLDLEALRNEINNEDSVATTATSETMPVAFATASTTAAAPSPPQQLREASPTPAPIDEPKAEPLKKAELPPPQHLREPAAQTGEAETAKDIEAARYAIQIGAFGSEKEAMSRLEAVRSRAANVLQGHSGVAQTATKSGKQIYRARFVAFEEGKATKACTELRRMSVDCFVMKSE